MNFDASDLISGLLGAVIGGVFAIGGGIWTNRREIIREARMHIYEELLPPLLRRDGYRSAAALVEHSRRLLRASPRTGRGDRKIIAQIWEKTPLVANAAIAVIREQKLDSDTLQYQAPRVLEDTLIKQGDELLAMVRSFDEHLKKRIL